MTKELLTPVLALALGLSSSVASAQDATAVPDTQPPAESVPVPPSASPPPPAAVAAAAPSAPAGQWVYTTRYGWIWEPYGEAYTYMNQGSAYTYAYYPAYGWRWVYSPWVVGFGPEPYWGVRGWAHFGWYGAHGYRGGYHAVYPTHYSRPAYYRGAPARGATHWSGGHAFRGGGRGHR